MDGPSVKVNDNTADKILKKQIYVTQVNNGKLITRKKN